MLPGPVFQAELLTTARRPRYYAMRFLYGAALLFFIWRNDPGVHSWYDPAGSNGMSIEELSRLGKTLFLTFVLVQGIAVLLLTPALTAGVIADERQRRTLGYLLASRLSSAEIVLGKLAARFLNVLVFLAIGLPVTSLLSLFGGVDPALVVLAFGVTLCTAFFLSALSILISTHARRAREAISLAYMLALFWFFAPTMIKILMPMGGGEWLRVYEWVRPVNEWVAPSSPFSLVSSLNAAANPARFVELLCWMMGLQVGYGFLFLLIAVVRLRPVGRYEADGSGQGWTHRLSRRKRIFPRPVCGDDAMLWKERYTSRTSVATKTATSLVVILVLSLLGYLTYDYAKPAFVELAANGYGSMAYSMGRESFNGYLRGMCTLIYVIWALGVASAASAGVTSEREEDTWVSLLTSPLKGYEIIRAKMIGAVWGLRWLGGLLVGLWLLGLAAGSIHPLGFAAVLIETTAFIWFASALGTYLSLRSRTSGRALLATMFVLFVVNGGYLTCCLPIHNDPWWLFVGMTPMTEAYSLASYRDIRQYFDGQSPGFSPFRGSNGILGIFVGTLAYVVAAALLTQLGFSRFEIEADRPTRARRSATRTSEAPEASRPVEVDPEPLAEDEVEAG